MKKIFCALTLAGCFTFASAQEEIDLQHFNAERLKITRKGMLVLGAWGLGNLLAGASLGATTNGVSKNFHIMNAGWGGVNLLIAGLGYKNTLHKNQAWDLATTLNEQASLEKLLLLNAGLDVAYVMTGFFLRERALRHEPGTTSYDRLKGFGNSLLLQGGFLFAFDLVLYFFAHQHYNLELAPWLERIQVSANSVTISIPLAGK